MPRTDAAPCEVCGRRMSSKRALECHLRIHTGERPFHCSQCDRTYLCKSGLRRHKRKHDTATTQGYQLKVCFPNIKRKRLGKETKDPDKSICDSERKQERTTKTDSDASRLDGAGRDNLVVKHLTKDGTADQGVFVIDDDVVPTFKDTQKHQGFKQSKVKDFNYMCDSIPPSFVNVATANDSDENHTDRPLVLGCRNPNTQRHAHDNDAAVIGPVLGSNRVSGNLPGKSFGMYLKSVLAQQNVEQIRKNPYQCHSCQRCFARESVFEKHILSSNCHLEDKKQVFDCVVCDKVYASRCILTRHMRTHTAEYPHQCDECGRRFHRRDNMLRHKNAHTRGDAGNVVLSKAD
ncbi:zinc finger protein 93-like [Haliotis rufescens]|uniref:zinc finger protein 93-like n=1 Tax=Haliotis rufescens TaxID=6454 RepID=UPI00201FACA9|nr:zinc finger protein 93-like [Haliotis rufescens]